MDRKNWLELIKILAIALVVSIVMFFIFSKVIVEDDVNYQELEEAKQKQKPFLRDAQ